MALEPAFDNIDDLVPANPVANDPVDAGDDHIRGIKNALKGNVSGDAVATQLLQAGVVALNADAKGIQVSGQVLISDPAPVNPDEAARKDYVDAQIAALQTQLDDLINGTTPFTGVVSGVDFIATG